MWNGILAAAAVFCVLAVAHALAFPPFAATDEAANIGYALSVADGTLPSLDTPIPDDRIPGLTEQLTRRRSMGRADWVWTANHPPLFFVIAALPLKLGLVLDRPVLGVWLVRLVDVLLGGSLVVAIGWLAARLYPTRPKIPILAATWVSVLPLFAAQGPLVYCDQAAHALGTCCIVLTLSPKDVSKNVLTLLASCATAAVLTRISGVVFVELAVMLWIVRGGSWRKAFIVFTPAVLAVLLLLGRSASMYGDISGSGYNLVKLGRPPGPPILWLLTSPEVYLDQLLQLVGTGFRSVALWEAPSIEVGLPALYVAMASAFLLPMIGLLVAVRRGSIRPTTLWTPAILGLLPIAALAMLMLHTSRGGYEHARYLFMALPVAAIVIAIGLDALPPWLQALGFATTLGFVVMVSLPGYAAGHWVDPNVVTRATAFMSAHWLTGPILPGATLLALAGPLWLLVRSWRAADDSKSKVG